MEFKASTFLAIMLSINVVLTLAQGAISAENPDLVYIDSENTPSGQLGDNISISTPDAEYVEGGDEGVTQISTAKNIANKLESAWGFISGIFTQPRGFMKDAGIPSPIVNGFSIIWYAIAFMAFIGWIRGKNQ